MSQECLLDDQEIDQLLALPLDGPQEWLEVSEKDQFRPPQGGASMWPDISLVLELVNAKRSAWNQESEYASGLSKVGYHPHHPQLEVE